MRDTRVDLRRVLGQAAAGGFITVAFGLVGAGAAHAGPRIAIPGMIGTPESGAREVVAPAAGEAANAVNSVIYLAEGDPLPTAGG